MRTKGIPGHGPPSDREEVKAFKELLVAGRDRIVALIKEGKSVDEAIAAKPVEGLYKGGESRLSSEMSEG